MAGSVAPNIVTDGLILYADAANPKSYPGSGTIWNDISYSTLSCSLANLATFNSDNVGTISYPDTAANTTFNIPSPILDTIYTNNSLTLSVFFKFNFNNTFRDIIGLAQSSGNTPFGIRVSNFTTNYIFYDTTIGGVRNTNGVFQSSAISGSWYHACATFGSGVLRTYMNGRLVTQQSISGSLLPYTTNNLGNYFGYGYFVGNISNFQLYNRALSSTEVLQNYNALKGRFGL
jgi:hypothetical protein